MITDTPATSLDDPFTAVEMRTAARALLSRPMLGRRDDPDTRSHVRRHRERLVQIFADELGWRLDAHQTHVVRLAKVPGPGHVARGLHARSGRAFDPARYAVLCLLLAELEAQGETATAKRLFEAVTARAAGIKSLTFDQHVGADRRLFIHAVQAAADLGVLQLVDGDEEGFAAGAEGSDVLYRIDRDSLVQLPACQVPPSLAPGRDNVSDEHYPDTDAGRVRRRRHRVMRALVDEPVLYTEDLDTDERDYLVRQRRRIERLLEDVFGLDLEVRAEGWVAVDPGGDCTDMRWPEYGTVNVAALRICDELRRRHTAGLTESWPRDELVEFVRGLAAEYAGTWQKDRDTTERAADLTAQAINLLVPLRLVVVSPETDAIEALPAAGRFAAAGVENRDEPASPAGLFDEGKS